MDIRRKHVLLIKICELMTKKELILSKISLHQLVYILQELYSIGNFYDFKMYTYGPYAVELTTDLDYLFSNHLLQVEYCQGPSYFGSKVELGEKYKTIKDQQDTLFDGEDEALGSEDKILKVIELLGNNDARSLELRGAIIYLYKNEGTKTLEKIVERIQNIKPYFTEKEIELAVGELRDFLQ